jgi:hypothetical protein
MPKIQNTDNTKCWQGHRVTGTPVHWLYDYKGASTLERGWQFLKNLTISLLHILAVTFLGIYPKEFKIYFHTTCAKLFIVPLYIIARSCRQPRWPAVSDKINKFQ